MIPRAAASAAHAVGLKSIPVPPDHERKVSVSRQDLGEAERLKVKPHQIPKLRIAAAVDAAISMSADRPSFIDRLKDMGVEVEIIKKSGGEEQGIKYLLAGEKNWQKGSGIGKAYSLRSIDRRLAGDIDQLVAAQRFGDRKRKSAGMLDKLAREQQAGKEIVRWTNGYVAAVATDSEIRWRTGSAAEAAVCAALAREKGWEEMILSDRGADEKNRAAVEAYHRQGISVQLGGQRYPAPAAPVTGQEFSHGNDGTNSRTGQGGGGAAVPGLGATEVDGVSSQRSSQKTELRHGANRGPAGAARQAAEDGERNRPDAEKAATGATHEGEDMEDILDFLDESPAIQARDAAALEELAAAKPGDHNLQLLAGELEVEEKKTGGAEGAGSASAPRAPAPAVPAPPAIASAGTGVREEEEDRAVLEEIEAQLQDIYQESDWQAYWQQLPRREYRIQRDEAMPYAAARALALGHRREAVARVAGEKATARAEKHVADPAKRAATQQKAAGAKVRVDQNRQAEDKRLAEKAKDWANQKPKSKEGWKK